MKKQIETIYKISKIDKYIYLTYILVFSFLLTFFSEDEVKYYDFLITIWFLISSIIVVHITVFVLLKRYLFKKEFLKIISSVVILIGIFGLVDCILDYFISFDTSEDEETSILLFFSMYFFRFILTATLLGIIMIRKSIESQFLLLKAENAQKSSELKLLKTQIDPHFLFNNLNTLDALVDTDVEKAKLFIHRLAHLYQYLLANIEEEIISLEEELKFAENYCYLIEERFGDSYQFEFVVKSEGAKHKLLPPGAIQAVFENVVKHNTGSTRNPIKTELLVEADKVVVKNNIRANHNPVQSYGLGLNNLRARYEILSDKSIEVEMNSSDYEIILPLIDQLNS